jgi:beta-lactam-binding protein with PASTA domain
VDSDEPKGIVVGVDPESGSEVAPGATITLFVSRGPEPPGQEKKENREGDEEGDD